MVVLNDVGSSGKGMNLIVLEKKSMMIMLTVIVNAYVGPGTGRDWRKMELSSR